MNKFNIFKNIFSKVKIGQEDNVLRPRGKVTISENTKDNILFEEDNLVVDSFFDIIIGLFEQDTDKQITKLTLGSGGVVDSLLQTPTLKDKDLYELAFTKDELHNFMTEKILNKSITFSFVIEKDECNGDLGVQIISELGLCSTDGTMFARKTFTPIIKTNEKMLFIDWKLYW